MCTAPHNSTSVGQKGALPARVGSTSVGHQGALPARVGSTSVGHQGALPSRVRSTSVRHRCRAASARLRSLGRPPGGAAQRMFASRYCWLESVSALLVESTLSDRRVSPPAASRQSDALDDGRVGDVAVASSSWSMKIWTPDTLTGLDGPRPADSRLGWLPPCWLIRDAASMKMMLSSSAALKAALRAASSRPPPRRGEEGLGGAEEHETIFRRQSVALSSSEIEKSPEDIDIVMLTESFATEVRAQRVELIRRGETVIRHQRGVRGRLARGRRGWN